MLHVVPQAHIQQRTAGTQRIGQHIADLIKMSEAQRLRNALQGMCLAEGILPALGHQRFLKPGAGGFLRIQPDIFQQNLFAGNAAQGVGIIAVNALIEQFQCLHDFSILPIITEWGRHSECLPCILRFSGKNVHTAFS